MTDLALEPDEWGIYRLGPFTAVPDDPDTAAPEDFYLVFDERKEREVARFPIDRPDLVVAYMHGRHAEWVGQ